MRFCGSYPAVAPANRERVFERAPRAQLTSHCQEGSPQRYDSTALPSYCAYIVCDFSHNNCCPILWKAWTLEHHLDTGLSHEKDTSQPSTTIR